MLSDVTVAANGPPVTMTCVARADNLYWSVNNTGYTHKVTDPLLRKGFAFTNSHNESIVSGSVTVSVSKQYWTNNNTVVKCHAHHQSNNNTSVSAATLLIAGTYIIYLSLV